MPGTALGKLRTYPLILSLLLWSTGALGQVCTIDLGPDTTICQGATVTLTAPAGFPTYAWSTGSSATSITVGSGGTYWGEVSYPTGELATNGNFSAGNTGFNNQFNYNNTLTTDGNYWIGNNAASFHPQFLGTGNGAFLMVNAGWMHAGFDAWCQTIAVCPGQTYTLRVRAMSLASQGAPLLDWAVDGVQLNDFMQTTGQAAWTLFTRSWTSGPTQTSATICVRVASGHGIGNDFGLDDISISSTIVLRDYVDVTVTPLPSFDLGPNATLCDGQNLVLDAGVTGGSYLWQDGATASTYVVSGPGNYNVTVTADNCSATDAITVNYTALPVFDLGTDITLCAGETITLDASVPGGSYVWQDGSTNSTYVVNGQGNYFVQVTANNCPATDAISVDYTPLPVVDIGPDQVVCAGNTVTLDATTPSGTYLWQDGTATATYTAGTPGTYSVQVTADNCVATDDMELSVTPLPVVDLGPDQTVCPGTSVPLDATVTGGSYVWHDGSTDPIYTATTPGTYTVTVTANNCPTTDSFVLSHFTLQTVDLGPDLTLCAGQGTTLGSPVAGATYVWSTGASTPTIGVSSAGIYWLDVVLNGCTVRDSIEVFVTPLPTVDLGADTTLCPGNTMVLDMTTPGGSYVWSTGATSPTITVGPGVYSVTVTANNCPRTRSITIDEWPAAAVEIGDDVQLCPGTTLVLDATQSGASYLWQDGSTDGSFTVTTGGNYDVQLTDANGCTATDALTVTYAAPAPISLGADTTLCAGATLTLDATVTGASYAWSTGETTPTIDVLTAATYSVVVTQGNCTVSDAIDVQVVAAPTVDLGNDTTLCPGETLVLNAAGTGPTYAWSTGASTASIVVTTGGTYTVTVTNSANCSTSDAIAVTVANAATVDLGPDVTVCAGEAFTFDAMQPGATYAWSTGATTSTIDVMDAGEYWVEVVLGTCAFSDTVVVTVSDPQVDLGDDISLCTGESAVLDASWPNATYAWSTGAISSSITVSTSDTYSVVVSLDGCSVTDDVLVNVLSATSLDLGADVDLCEGESVELIATTPSATYTWSTGAASSTIEVDETGTYWVDVSTNGCSVSDTVLVTVAPSPQVDLGEDLTLCNGETTVSLDANWPGATYAWNNGASSATLEVDTDGTYSVVVDLNGCTASDEVVVQFGSIAFDLGPDTVLCPGEELVLEVDLPDGTVTWNNGIIGPVLTVDEAGTYSMVFTANSGCEARDTIIVTYADPGVFDLGPDLVLCAGETVELDATLPGATYLWNDGTTDPIRTITASGTYAVEAFIGACALTDAVSIDFTPLPTIDLGNDISLCPGATALFDATTPDATYAWQDGSTGPTFSTTAAGIVSVTVTVDGCAATDEATFTVIDGPAMPLGSDTTICAGSTLLLDAAQSSASFLWDDGSTSPSRTIFAEGVYWVDIARNDCTVRDSIAVVVFAPEDLDLGPDIELCSGASATLDATVPGASYSWNTGATSSTLSVVEAGTYSVTITLSGCSAQDMVTVDLITLAPLDLGANITLCEGESVELNSGAVSGTIQWSTGASTPSITVQNAGLYTATLTDQGCSVSASVQVETTPLITTVSLGGDRTLCNGATEVLEATAIPGATYVWSTGATGALLAIDAPGTYTVTASGECINATATIVVEPGDCGTYVFVPNSFTPNEDGINDHFLPSLDGRVDRFELFIFDRWGERIHSTTDRSEGWNGSYDGSWAQDGVYVWVIEYRVLSPDGVKSERLVGHLTLLR